jgi:sulfur-carrier protein adenylyltransferase/sulfurtransferase
MKSADLLARIEEWPVDKVRGFVARHHPEDYQLIDVRQLQQYGVEHLPGSLCIPAENLPTSLGNLSTDKPTIVYCDRGALSRAAAQVLVKSGFSDVHILQGGLHAWQYGFSTGLPHQLYAPLVNAEKAEEQAALAWTMEENARRFYQAMADTLDEADVAALFVELAEAENHHKATLKALWEALAGCPAGEDFAASSLSPDGVMEGGIALDEALQWAKQSSTAIILDFAMAMELSAYDHYLYLQRNSDNPDSKRLFEVMADEERHHLRELGQSLEKIMAS